jgi:fucose permease
MTPQAKKYLTRPGQSRSEKFWSVLLMTLFEVGAMLGAILTAVFWLWGAAKTKHNNEEEYYKSCPDGTPLYSPISFFHGNDPD